jgi:Tfp pilus assembly protein PilO
MPSPYDYMQNRWLTWHERWPVPEIESLKRQIETIKREIARREAAVVDRECIERDVAEMQEVLATLERLMPPF